MDEVFKCNRFLFTKETKERRIKERETMNLYILDINMYFFFNLNKSYIHFLLLSVFPIGTAPKRRHQTR